LECGSSLYPHTHFFSIFAALIFIPHIRWLKKKGIPAGLSVLLLILLFAFIVTILSMIVVKGTIQFGNKIPIYQTNLVGFIDTLTHYSPTRRYFLEFNFTQYYLNHDLSYEK